jgi:UDP-2,3-diacylglucosamine hydrolase
LISSLSFLSNYLPKESILTQRRPTESEWKDIYFGRDLAKKIAGLDIGQTVVVKQKAILAVEALEGTDVTILRGGLIGQGGATVVKVSKPQQDMRFDVPVIGARTVRTLIKANISCLAIEAGKTLVLDRRKLLVLADRKGIAIAVI